MAHFDAAPFHLDLVVELLNLAHPLRQAVRSVPRENSYPVLRNPEEILPMMVRAVGTQADFHAMTAVKTKTRRATITVRTMVIPGLEWFLRPRMTLTRL